MKAELYIKAARSNFEERVDSMLLALNPIGASPHNLEVKGKVQRVVGSVIKAEVPGGVLGDMCYLQNQDGSRIGAEIISLEEGGVLLTAHGSLDGVGSSTTVQSTYTGHSIGVGPEILGRVVDGLGQPIDDMGPLVTQNTRLVSCSPPNPISRRPIGNPIEFGVKAIDNFLTCGVGQRIGIFAAAGVGKSTLLGMFIRYAKTDIVVIGLVGERGREVREFIENEIGVESMHRAVVVVATSDRPAVERAKAAFVATTIAEYFRDCGRQVVLLIDSLTRFARAQREIGLAAGEVPTRRGFPSSVFTQLPQLLERAGNSESEGSITALYTVLVEGGDFSEPVADEVRSILDGHIVLSQKLAEKGHFPAIDVSSSVSRLMNKIVSAEHLAFAQRFRALLAAYDEVELLIRVGEYKKGNDPLADEAVGKIKEMKALLVQALDEPCSSDEAFVELSKLCGG